MIQIKQAYFSNYTGYKEVQNEKICEPTSFQRHDMYIL